MWHHHRRSRYSQSASDLPRAGLSEVCRDSPQGAGVKLLEIALDAKERVGRWVAVEAERLEDMLAEARMKAEPDIPRPNKASNGSGDESQSGNERVNPRRRGPRPVEPEERA